MQGAARKSVQGTVRSTEERNVSRGGSEVMLELSLRTRTKQMSKATEGSVSEQAFWYE